VIESPFDPYEAGATYMLRPVGAPADGSRDFRVAAGSFLRHRRSAPGVWSALWRHKWYVTGGFGIVLAPILIFWMRVSAWKVVVASIPPVLLAIFLPSVGLWVLLPFSAAVVGLSFALEASRGEGEEWLHASWGFAMQIAPLLLAGVLVAGFLLGRPGHPGVVPARYVEMLVGDSPDRLLSATGWGGGSFEGLVRWAWPVWTNLFASVFGAFMYFATLTEVPILQGLIGSGMGRGPALALLLAGPALSLPNMLVIRSVMGTEKTIVFCSLVIVMATISGLVFGAAF
jgi:hypothetical protein